MPLPQLTEQVSHALHEFQVQFTGSIVGLNYLHMVKCHKNMTPSTPQNKKTNTTANEIDDETQLFDISQAVYNFSNGFNYHKCLTGYD